MVVIGSASHCETPTQHSKLLWRATWMQRPSFWWTWKRKLRPFFLPVQTVLYQTVSIICCCRLFHVPSGVTALYCLFKSQTRIDFPDCLFKCSEGLFHAVYRPEKFPCGFAVNFPPCVLLYFSELRWGHLGETDSRVSVPLTHRLGSAGGNAFKQ